MVENESMLFENLNFRPKLAVVIVKKKGNARFFAKMGSTSMVNPPPGTIIDHTVTNGEFIFYCTD